MDATMYLKKENELFSSHSSNSKAGGISSAGSNFSNRLSSALYQSDSGMPCPCQRNNFKEKNEKKNQILLKMF